MVFIKLFLSLRYYGFYVAFWLVHVIIIDVICSYTIPWPYVETVSVILKQNSINIGFNFQLLKDLENGKMLPFTFVEYEILLSLPGSKGNAIV